MTDGALIKAAAVATVVVRAAMALAYSDCSSRMQATTNGGQEVARQPDLENALESHLARCRELGDRQERLA